MIPLDEAKAATARVSSPNPPARPKRKLVEGVIKIADRGMVYGPEKSGKSTFLSAIKGAVWLCQDGGTAQLDVRRWPDTPKTWEDALQALDDMWIERNDHGITAVVVDPLNWLETNLLIPYAEKHCDSKNKFAKFDIMATQWRLFRTKLERFWEAGIHVWLIAHSKLKEHNDSEGENFSRVGLDMQGSGAGMFLQWVDAILYVKKDHYAVAVAGGKGKMKAGGSGASYICTEDRPGFAAGNRWGLPPRLELSWDALTEARRGALEDIKERIEAALVELESLGKMKIRAKIEEVMGAPGARLSEILNTVVAKLEASRPTPETTEDDTRGVVASAEPATETTEEQEEES